MNRLMLSSSLVFSNLVFSSLFFGVTPPAAMARIRPEPTMCFIRMANGTFRDLTAVCGANRYVTIAPVAAVAPQAAPQAVPQNVAAPETPRQNTVQTNRTRIIRTIENPPVGSGGVPSQSPTR